MNKRKFIKLCSVGIAGALLPILYTSCKKNDLELITGHDKKDLKETINNHLLQADFTDFKQHNDVFRQNRCILITDDYKIISDSVLFKKFETNTILQVHAKAIVKCNFDIYKSDFRIVSKVRKNEYLEIMKTNIPGQIIRYYKWEEEKIINYPIKQNIKSERDGRVFDENFNLPCIMSSSRFIELKQERHDS